MSVLGYSHSVTTDAAIEPVSVDEAKRNCDYDDNYRDADFARWIEEARKQVELDTGRALISQTHQLKLDAFDHSKDYIELPRPPLISVTTGAITYVPTTGGTATWGQSGAWSTDTDREPGLILLDWQATYPGTRDQRNAVTISYTAGYGTAAEDVPAGLRSAILFLVKHRFENPDFAMTAAMHDIPMGYHDLIAQYSTRRYR